MMPLGFLPINRLTTMMATMAAAAAKKMVQLF
jgi:hypothetical protein